MESDNSDGNTFCDILEQSDVLVRLLLLLLLLASVLLIFLGDPHPVEVLVRPLYQYSQPILLK